MERFEGIVLGKTPLSEADELIACLTKERGKVLMRARGVRKGRAKHKGPLQEFNYVRLYAVEGKAGPLIIDTNLVNSFPNIKGSLDKLSAVRTVSTTLLNVLPVEYADMVLWWQIVDFFSVLEEFSGDESRLHIAPALFLLSMLKMHGHGPTFEKCVLCSAPIPFTERCVFSFREGGVVDRACMVDDDDAMALAPAQRAILHSWMSLSLAEAVGSDVEEEMLRDSCIIIDKFAKWHLGERASALFVHENRP